MQVDYYEFIPFLSLAKNELDNEHNRHQADLIVRAADLAIVLDDLDDVGGAADFSGVGREQAYTKEQLVDLSNLLLNEVRLRSDSANPDTPVSIRLPGDDTVVLAHKVCNSALKIPRPLPLVLHSDPPIS